VFGIEPPVVILSMLKVNPNLRIGFKGAHAER
jgi:hypothetical protein